MALQVEQRLAGDVADQLDLVGPEANAAGPERFEVVEVAGRVDGCPGVPQGSIHLERDGVPIGGGAHRSDQAKSTSG